MSNTRKKFLSQVTESFIVYHSDDEIQGIKWLENHAPFSISVKQGLLKDPLQTILTAHPQDLLFRLFSTTRIKIMPLLLLCLRLVLLSLILRLEHEYLLQHQMLQSEFRIHTRLLGRQSRIYTRS
jgi:hypothetical protein